MMDPSEAKRWGFVVGLPHLVMSIVMSIVQIACLC